MRQCRSGFSFGYRNAAAAFKAAAMTEAAVAFCAVLEFLACPRPHTQRLHVLTVVASKCGESVFLHFSSGGNTILLEQHKKLDGGCNVLFLPKVANSERFKVFKTKTV